tara:strand:- start:494 stop:742 length:249 start_codon:yes stop_codon:yes gene_type:complete
VKSLFKRAKSIWTNAVLLVVCMAIGLRLGPSLFREASERLGRTFAWPIRLLGGSLLGLMGGFAWFWYEERSESELRPALIRA